MQWEVSEILIKIIIGVMLLLCVIKDIKKKEISCIAVILGVMGIIFVFVINGDISLWNMAGGSVVGITMMLISKISKGQVGMGDGVVLVATGLGLGLWNNLILLMYALFFVAVFSAVLLIRKKNTRKDTIPFMPFLFLGFICTISI